MKVTDLMNVPVLILSVLFAIVGFVLLGVGPVDSDASWKYAPVILVTSYTILFPLSVLLKK